MSEISEISKIKEGRGKGSGPDYKPWIKIREISSLGTASTVQDYKNGREVHLLTQGELYYYYLLRWDDSVIDIREQFPLDLATTKAICDEMGYMYPNNGRTHMTTDLLVTHVDGTYAAYCVKLDRKELDNPRTLEKIEIERLYWVRRGVEFRLVYKSDLNPLVIRNIMDVVSCYNPANVQDAFGAIRYMIAHKEIEVDFTKPIDYRALIKQYTR